MQPVHLIIDHACGTHLYAMHRAWVRDLAAALSPNVVRAVPLSASATPGKSERGRVTLTLKSENDEAVMRYSKYLYV